MNVKLVMARELLPDVSVYHPAFLRDKIDLEVNAEFAREIQTRLSELAALIVLEEVRQLSFQNLQNPSPQAE